ncbi:MAG: hypothetical protein MK035_08080 [Dehalococcoidia bacterium]|nr:hypothetical protein [Dehalococcoidia bacterium]
MSSQLLGKMKSKIKNLSFKSKIDALTRQELRFSSLNGRDQGKIHGRSTEGIPDGSPYATIDDVLHSMGCDLFGGTRYNITIQVQEIPDVKKKRTKKEVS